MSNAEAIEPQIGTIVDNKYRIDCLIGQGGMGKVFRVTHIHLNKVFALKLMSAGNAKRLSRFKREAEALAKINHPNVVMVTDFGVTQEDAPYIVMDYIEGMTLRKYLKTKGSFTEKEAIQIAKQICAGLHEAHINSITHRDLKPDNIMVQWLSDGDIMARVVDFGLAKLNEPTGSSSNLTEDREMPGTIRYMAPEQLCRLNVDHRTDIFSFCLIIYELLTGDVPHVVVSKAKPLNELRSDISARFSEIILKGLAQDARERQQSVLEIKRELELLEQTSASHFPALKVNTRSLPAVPTSDNSSPHNTQLSSPTNITTLNNARSSSEGRIDSNSTSSSQTNLPASSSRRNIILAAAAMLVLMLIVAGVLIYPSLSSRSGSVSDSKQLPDNAIPKLVPVIGGKFRMGSNSGDDFARPEHDELVKPFRVSNFLITNYQYGEFVKRNNYRLPAHWNGGATAPPDLLDKPVTNITWNDANAYCIWLSTQTGTKYRLISESEWEFIARKQTELGLKEVVGEYVEWTSSSFYIYPGSKMKAKQTADSSIYIFRGKSKDAKDANQDPLSFRMWNRSDYTFNTLGFRVASD